MEGNQEPKSPADHQATSTSMPAGKPAATAGAVISDLLSKLKPSRILVDRSWIPTFRETCYLPSTSATDSNESETASSQQDDQDEAMPTSWQQHLSAAPENAFRSSFSDLLSMSSHPSLVWFGEQHHQPHVIRAQLQLLAALAGQRDRLASNTSRPVKYHLHLLFEHFSYADQPLLDRFRLGKYSIGEFCGAYHDRSNEGFNIEMYAPLLLLAREKGVNIWGGFPERPWARAVLREGVGKAQQLEESRVSQQAGEPSREKKKVDDGANVMALPPMPSLPLSERWSIPTFTAWSNISTITASHRTFLSSLMNPQGPPAFPLLHSAASASASSADQEQYPTERIPSPPQQLKGFEPAQALKDSYLAHATSCLLKEGHELVSSSSSVESSDSSQPPKQLHDATDDVVEHRNIVMVVAGSGHLQAGFGAPERVTKDNDVKSLTVVSMPLDASLWLGPEWQGPRGGQGAEEGSTNGPIAVPVDTLKATRASSESEDAGALSRRAAIEEGWGRKLADAIVLYDWVDTDSPPPASAPSAQSDATQDTPSAGEASNVDARAANAGDSRRADD